MLPDSVNVTGAVHYCKSTFASVFPKKQLYPGWNICSHGRQKGFRWTLCTPSTSHHL